MVCRESPKSQIPRSQLVPTRINSCQTPLVVLGGGWRGWSLTDTLQHSTDQLLISKDTITLSPVPLPSADTRLTCPVAYYRYQSHILILIAAQSCGTDPYSLRLAATLELSKSGPFFIRPVSRINQHDSGKTLSHADALSSSSESCVELPLLCCLGWACFAVHPHSSIPFFPPLLAPLFPGRILLYED